MSLKQIEYVDKILPCYGCSGVTDYVSLFNKSTIKDWDKLNDKLKNDLDYIKSIFPIKTLNLGRLGDEITQIQSVALLRGLMKLAKIDFVTVRHKTEEFMRLDNDKKNLVYYIIHQKMLTTKVRPVPLKKNFEKNDCKITKRFLVKFTPNNKLPESHKFVLLIGETEVLRTDKLIYDKSCDMWEIKFCEEMMVLNTNIPVELSNAFYFNVVSTHCIMVYSKVKCELFIEYYDDINIPEFAMKHETWKLNKWVNGLPTEEIETTEVDVPVAKLESYIKYATDAYDTSTNILSYACGMAGMKFSHKPRKYLSADESIIDPAWKYYKDAIEKTKKYYNK